MRIVKEGGTKDQWAINAVSRFFPRSITCANCLTLFDVESVSDVRRVRYYEYGEGEAEVKCPHCQTLLRIHNREWDAVINAIDYLLPKPKNPLVRFFQSIPIG